MKNKISKKLNLTNAAILAGALLFFCILSIVVFNFYMRRTIKDQLLAENAMSYRLAVVGALDREADIPLETARARVLENILQRTADIRRNNIYSALAESISMVFVKSDDEPYKMTYSSLDGATGKYDIDKLSTQVDEAIDGVIRVSVDGVDYFCTLQQSEPKGPKNVTMTVISMVPLSSIQRANRQYIFVFMVCATILVMISIAIMSFMSDRITKPIVKVTNLTKEYAKREFKNKYIANTNDEIEDLSIAVSTMADSLEKQDIQREKMFRHISHELKTPLTAIYGYAEGIKTGVFRNAEEPLDIIMKESLRIKKLTEDIIYLSKLESHVEAFKMEKCDISDTMIKAIQSIESIAIMKDIDIDYVPISIEMIDADCDKIHRALINILSNSVKYTKDRIEIEIKDAGDTVEIIVADNGNGFNQEDIETLLSGMTKEKSDGSGIGLSIVNEIIKAHRGEFYIGNNEAGGAIFSIVLKKKQQ
ncbi:MAG: HAMP domain-containing sensor histidine kinase [Eubacteriales bacterium]